MTTEQEIEYSPTPEEVDEMIRDSIAENLHDITVIERFILDLSEDVAGDSRRVMFDLLRLLQKRYLDIFKNENAYAIVQEYYSETPF